ncbi:MAG: hypothetical protein ACAH95_15950 [Fimbriimonas sp.]
MSKVSSDRLLDQLNERELVLLCELLRIEDELQRCSLLETQGDRILYELLLDQFELLIDRLSPEDDELWGHVWRIVDWLRIDALHRGEDEYSFEALVARAEINKGAPLNEDEIEQFRELALEMAQLDRELSAEG